MFIMVGILYKNKQLYGYRLVNYIEKRKKLETKDCSLDQVKLAFSRGAKIDNLSVNNSKIVITKGIESHYTKIGIEEGVSKSKLRFGYLIKKSDIIAMVGDCGNVIEYPLSEIHSIKKKYLIPNDWDYYSKYTGEQIGVETPKGVITAQMNANEEDILVLCMDNYSIEAKMIGLNDVMNDNVDYINNDNLKAAIVNGYILGLVSVQLEAESIDKYKGIVDLVDVNLITSILLTLGQREIEYKGNIFNKIYSLPDNVEQYNKMREYMYSDEHPKIYFTYNQNTPIALYRTFSERGIRYMMSFGNDLYWEDIEVIYYDITHNICTYKNIILNSNQMVVYAIDGVISYDIDKLHKEYKGKIREAERCCGNRLLGIKHTEMLNERNEVVQLETCSKNVIIDDNITKLLQNSIIVNSDYNTRVIIGENVTECRGAFRFRGEQIEFRELQIIVKCKITEELFNEIEEYRRKVDLNNQEITYDMVDNIPSLAYAHNYRISISNLQKLISKYGVADNNIAHMLKAINMTVEEAFKYDKETVIHVK